MPILAWAGIALVVALLSGARTGFRTEAQMKDEEKK